MQVVAPSEPASADAQSGAGNAAAHAANRLSSVPEEPEVFFDAVSGDQGNFAGEHSVPIQAGLLDEIQPVLLGGHVVPVQQAVWEYTVPEKDPAVPVQPRPKPVVHRAAPVVQLVSVSGKVPASRNL